MSSWRLAKSLVTLLAEVNAHYPGRNKASDGTIGNAAHQQEGNKSDHNPWVKDATGEGVVTALDVTHDPAHGVDTYAMAERLRVARDPRIKYVISDRRIFDGTAGGGDYTWRTYTGTSDPHTNHMHVSVGSSASAYDNVSPWTGVAVATPAKPAESQEQKINDDDFILKNVVNPVDGTRTTVHVALSAIWKILTESKNVT